MMRSSPFIVPERTSRRGVVLIIVLACIAVIAVLLGGLVKGSMQWSRQARYATWKQQAEQLANSGLNRAVASYKNSSDYKGETWELTETDGLDWPATVRIGITETNSNRQIEVKVVYAEATGRPVRSERTITLPTTAEEPNE